MKRKFTLIKFSILTLSLCGILTSAKAAAPGDPYPVYLTEGATVTLGLATVLKTGEKAVWTENGEELGSNATTGAYTVPPGQSVGIHTYKVHLISPDACEGDVTEYQIYVLPTPSVTLAASTNLYCTNAETPLSALNATADADPLPIGVKYIFTWEGTLGSTTKNPTEGWGELGAQATTSSIFNLTSTDIGTYNLKVKVEYAVTDPSKSVLRTDAGTVTAMTKVQSVEVAPKPATPVIVVAAE